MEKGTGTLRRQSEPQLLESRQHELHRAPPLPRTLLISICRRYTCNMAAGTALEIVPIWARTEEACNIGHPSLYRRHTCEVDSSSTSQACRRLSPAMALVAGGACSHSSKK